MLHCRQIIGYFDQKRIPSSKDIDQNEIAKLITMMIAIEFA